MTIIRALLTEYGMGWTINRLLYSAKLKMMMLLPSTEKLFEKTVDVKRIDIFEFDVKAIEGFLKGLSKEKQAEILAIADKALNGVITGFSSIELDYGNPINWHYTPLTKIEINKDAKWYCIPDFDQKLGDIKVIWEASRFTHFFYFVRAYLLTGDRKYYQGFSQQLKHWLDNNPYPYGANYKCGQECTLRMINALMAYTIFNCCGIASVGDEKNIRILVEVCYKKVLANFFYAHKCIKNNHTFSEICGLIIGAWCCEDEARVRKAYRLLDKEIESQFYPDGGFKQYSFNYQRFTLQIVECICKASEKTGINISEESKNRIKNSVLLMFQVQNDTGDVPNYGSNDGALIFPVTSCKYRDFRPALNTVYALTEGFRLYGNGDYDEELLWFGGAETPKVKTEHKSSAFYESGFFTIRHDGGFLMTYLQDFKSRPAHMDQLHIDLWHNGVNILCDSGTYSYASEIGKELTSTAGHNTVKIAGIEQMNKRGAFLVYDWTSRKNIKYDANVFSGTMVSRNGYSHKRQIFKTEWGYKIEDVVNGKGEYCEFYFHTPCEVRVVPGGFELLWEGKTICTIRNSDGDIEVKKAYRSLYYLQKEEINCVVIRCNINDKKCIMNFNIVLLNERRQS